MSENRVIIAPEDAIYTNGVEYGKKIHLANNDDGKGWYIVPISEYENSLNERSDTDELLLNSG